jgi:hypothetical protein
MNIEASAQTDYEALAILGQALDTVIASYKQLLAHCSLIFPQGSSNCG